MERRAQGDTLVEVLMAVVILSVVIVGAITMMARGLTAAQTAIEHTQVRQSISAQSEMLRYLRDSYLQDPNSAAAAQWNAMFGTPLYANTTQSSYGGTCAVTSGKNGFYLTQSAGNVTINAFNPALQPATAAIPGQGLWIEARRSAAGISPAYIDFQFRGCWRGTGASAQQQTITGLRLYDPAH